MSERHGVIEYDIDGYVRHRWRNGGKVILDVDLHGGHEISVAFEERYLSRESIAQLDSIKVSDRIKAKVAERRQVSYDGKTVELVWARSEALK